MNAPDKAAVLAHLQGELHALRRPIHPPQVAVWLAKLPPSALLGEAQQLARELAGIAGYGHTPQRGCEHATVTLDTTSVLIEYEADSGSGGSRDEPPEPASFAVCSVLINGCWLDASIFPEEQHIKWEEEVAEQMAGAREDDEIEAHIASQEWA